MNTPGLGTRLRRLLAALDQGVADTYVRSDLDFEPRWYGVVSLLLEERELAVGQLARALGQSHVAVLQVADALALRGLVGERRDPADRRRRLLTLTPEGHALALRAQPVWSAIHRAADALLAEAAPALLAELDALDEALRAQSFADRIAEEAR